MQARWRHQDTYFLIHLENQAAAQAEFGQRMFRYFARLQEKHNLPIYPVVIFSYDQPRRPEPEHYRPRVKLECLRMLAKLKLDPARVQLISGFVDTYLRLDEREEQQFQAKLQWEAPGQEEEVMQIVTSWMQQGIEQGLQRGRQEGRQEEAAALVLRLLFRRESLALKPIHRVLVAAVPAGWREIASRTDELVSR